MIENYNLFDISTPKQWKTISSKNLKEDGEYPVYGANGIIGYYDKYNHEEETVLITCRGATCGSVNLSKPFSYINGNAMAIDNVDNSKINTKYLFYFFKQYNFNNVITGTAQPQITRTSLKNVTVPIPDLPTQNKIVALLDKASALVQKREKSIALLDELLRAQFLEMFGDPVLNPRGWKTQIINELCNIQGGLTISQSKRQNHPFEMPYLRVANVFRGEIDLNKIKNIKVTEKEIERVKLQKNDILVVEGHGNIEEIGRVAIWSNSELKMLHQNHLIRLRIKVNYLKVNYFEQYLNSDGGKFKMKSISNSTSGLNTISTGKVKTIDIPVPPIGLQNQFETIYHNIQAQKQTLTQSKSELENLYNSLLQRAFSGQFNFNVDIELDALLAAIDIEQDTDKEKHDIKEIVTVYAGRLLKRIAEQKFDNQTQYQQAKQVVFQMLEEGFLEQAYDEKVKAVKLKLV